MEHMRMNSAVDILAGNRLSEVVANLPKYQKQIMAEIPKLFYVIVVDEDTPKEGVGEEASLILQKPSFSFSYTRPVMQSLLQLMGCKTRHAFKISKRVFEIMKNEIPIKARDFDGNCGSLMDALRQFPEIEQDNLKGGNVEQEHDHKMTINEKDTISESDKKPFHFYKKRTTVVVKREKFLDVVCSALAEYRYVGPNQRADLLVACRIRERKESMTVLLCGTSGCGKSTLSSLLASRLGITTVISTDSIRHMMRSFVDEKENPLLWASTYHAGECLDPIAVAKAKARKKDKQLVGALVNGQLFTRESGIPSNVAQAECHGLHETLSKKQDKLDSSDKGKGFEANIVSEMVGSKVMAIEGYKAQCEMVIDSLDRLITAWEERKESVVVEGVHLSLNFVMGLMKKHPSIIPFMIYIASEEKHMERFAVRAKYMTLDPAKNKYVKYIRNIRTIQDYLCTRADKHLVPKVNNTNVDRSVASIHATIFSCLRRQEAGEHLYDQATNTVKVVEEEYRNQCVANSLSSKGMFKIIRRQGSLRRLMAIVNTDGSVAKAWPFESVDNDGKPILHHGSHSGIGSPVYGPLQIGRAEPVNLQFGNFGISSWPNDTGGTSRASSVDGSRADGNEVHSCYTSCSNSPRHSDGPAKEPTEELPVPGSDEEPDEAPVVDTEDELSDPGIKGIQEDEIEGSVDEESARSEEGYEDSGVYDEQDGGYWSDNPDSKQIVANWQNHGEAANWQSLEAFPLGAGKQQNCSQDIDSFYMKHDLALNSHMYSKPFFADPSLHFEYYSRSLSLARSRKPRPITSHLHSVHSRSQSVPSFVKYPGVVNGVTLSGVSRQPCSQ